MTLPSPSKIATLITSDQNLAGASLATRILLGRLRVEVRNNPAQLDAKVAELLDFARRNDYAAADLAHI